MNFMDISDLTEILNEDYFPGNASSSGDHIFIVRPDGETFTVWINADGDAMIGDTFIENGGFLTSFASAIADEVLFVRRDVKPAETSTEPASGSSLSEELFTESIAIKERITALDEKLKPFKESFYKFLQTGIPAGYLSFSDLTQPASEFSVDFDALNEKEVLFTTSAHDWDNEEIFTMPFAYVNDPEKWEAELSEQVFNDRSFALGVFKKVEALQGHSVNTVKRATSETDEVLLVGSHYESQKWEDGDLSSFHVILKSKGEVYRAADYFNITTLANDFSGPIGTFKV